MHEKLIESADALEAAIRAVKPRTVYLDAAANTCHGIRDHLRSDEKATATSVAATGTSGSQTPDAGAKSPDAKK